MSLKVAREEQRQQEQQHLRDKQTLSGELHTKDKQYTQLIRDGKLKQTEQVEDLRSKFEEQAREMENRYQERYSDLRAELGLRARTEVFTDATEISFNLFSGEPCGGEEE